MGGHRKGNTMSLSYRAPDFDLFKGYPIIKIYTGKTFKGEDEYITMGYRKALAVVDQIQHIRQFVERCEKTGDNK